MAVKKKKERGRPEKYSKELAEKICIEIATSCNGLHKICSRKNMPGVSTVFSWLAQDDKKDFLDMYERAKELQAEFLAQEILDIADDGRNDLMTVTYGDETYERENKEVTGRSKLRVDTRKWIMSKLLPRKYGDKLDLDHTSKGERISTVSEDTLIKLADRINNNAAS